VEILPPLDPLRENTPEAFRQATQQYTRIIEDYIRRCPEQWIWLHRRWRTRPVEEMKNAE
jgi:KDO2-lipid IV(A) lauroyltransferase